MLQQHLNTLHPDEPDYTCPHCDYPLGTGNVERIVTHLRLHSREVYKCAACPFHNRSKALVAAHVTTAHTEAFSVLLTRGPSGTQTCHVATTVAEAATMRRGISHRDDADDSTSTSTASASSSPAVVVAPLPVESASGAGVPPAKKNAYKNKFKCMVCTHMFDTRPLVASHARLVHSIKAQFQCRLCQMWHNFRKAMNDHLGSVHPEARLSDSISVFFTRVVVNEAEATTPIWRPSDPNRVSVRTTAVWVALQMWVLCCVWSRIHSKLINLLLVLVNLG